MSILKRLNKPIGKSLESKRDESEAPKGALTPEELISTRLQLEMNSQERKKQRDSHAEKTGVVGSEEYSKYLKKTYRKEDR